MMEYLPDPERTRRMTTEELRSHFLLQQLFQPGAISLRYVDLDRAVIGGIVPTVRALELEAGPEMAAACFAERREMGILNIGRSGSIIVDGRKFDLETKDILYVSRGSRTVFFESADENMPAKFYLVSYPAQAAHPTTLVRKGEADVIELGRAGKASLRRLYKYVRPGQVDSAQLVMGITDVQEGSVWNTMPAHTHARRSEVYLYFEMHEEDVVFHMMGEPTEIRTIVVRDGEAVLSPGWSIHAGAGTGQYAFCWAMGGENQDFDDMQFAAMASLR